MSYRIHQPASIAVLLVVGLFLAAVSQAQVTSIWNTTSGNFSNDANWDITQTPVNGDAAWFDTNATYQVDFTRHETNSLGRVTAGNVTFNMNGWRYLNNGTLGVTSVNYSVTSLPITNSAVTVTGGGTLEVRSGAYFGYSIGIAPGSSLTVTGGSTVVAVGGGHQGFEMRPGSQLIIDGAGSTFVESGGPYGPGISGNVTVQNGGLYRSTDAIGNTASSNKVLVSGPGSTIQVNGLGSAYGGLIEATVTNGGALWTSSIYYTGATGGLSNRLAVGGPGFASLAVASNNVSLGSGRFAINDLWGASGHILVSSNGTFRRVGAGTGIVVGDATAAASTFTLQDGTVEMGAGKQLIIESNMNANATIPTLRGAGTISKYNAGANFSIVNEGAIRVGDVSATPAMGTLNLIGGNLYQTNAAANSIMYFEFGDTGLDQINLDGGVATLTTGTNWFSLAAGSSTPTPGVKWGLGTYDFIIASNITYSPQYDNMISNLTAWGLTQDLDYRFGVFDLGSYEVLRLEFVPEPSTVLLLAGGGLLLWRWRARTRRGAARG